MDYIPFKKFGTVRVNLFFLIPTKRKFIWLISSNLYESIFATNQYINDMMKQYQNHGGGGCALF